MKRAFALLLLSLVTGCAITRSEVGTPVPDPTSLEIGRSTKADVLARMGPPRLVRRQFDGELYTWRRTLFESRSVTILPAYVKAFYYATAESRRDDLSLLFDRTGVLRGIGLRLETEEPD